MQKLLFSLFILIIFSACNNKTKTLASADTARVTDATYYFVRHADKVRAPNIGNNPPLNANGKARAKFWAKQLKDVDFDAVYSTNFKRTRSTALPTAKQNKLEIKIYEPSEDFYVNFKDTHVGKNVLVVGHSNTIPAFVNAVLGEQKYNEIDDSTFGNLYIVRVKDGVAEAELKDFNSWSKQ
ncbi:histidine phosphatase family protein [Leeuwenhoekiella sp. MAR_2009_132]|uniref:histidine phosphatase family protein n=1 Tax=Leeuwenhoekiella sp. MAR_2009_132 TaxID=1392489 RepID=UPI000569038C|nr:histidine phosphatase family protein [Leeuwenhoekiella sp. MAR_2009_132]